MISPFCIFRVPDTVMQTPYQARIPCRQCGRGDLCGIDVCAVDAILPHIPQTNCLDEVRRVQADDNIIGPARGCSTR